VNLRILPYYTINHPLKKNEKIIISDREEISRTVHQVYEITRNKNTDRVRLIRVHISGEKREKKIDSGRIRQYEKNFRELDQLNYQKAKLHEIIRFTRSLLIAYILYMAPETFWTPIVSLFNLIAHGLSDYARWCIIIFFPLKAGISSFGSIFSIRGKINLGFKGRWHNIHDSSSALTIFDRIDDSIENELNEDIVQFIKHLKEKNTGHRELIERISSLLDNIWEREIPSDLNDQLLKVIREGEQCELWGEMVKLNMLRKEIVYFLTAGDHNFSTIHHFYPSGNIDKTLPLSMADIRFHSFSLQSDKLESFNENKAIQKLQDSIIDDYRKLADAENRDEVTALLNKISLGFETLRDESGRYHMGQNHQIPHEKGLTTANFYHNLYKIFGRARGDIENEYRRTSYGLIPIKTFRAVNKRLKMLFSDLEVFIDGTSSSKWKTKWKMLKSSGGTNLPMGFATSFLILFITASLLSFQIVETGDQIIRKDLKIAYMGKLFNREISITNWDNRRTLIWHLPRPLSQQSIINRERRTISIYMIMGEHYGANLLQNLLSELSGQLGTKFDVIELNISYIPRNAEKWSLYDIDNKGERRLLRDLSELTSDWGNKRGHDLTSFSSKDFEIFFRQLTEMGVIEDYLRRSFSQTTFSTNIYYGSLSERFDSGINAVLNEFERKITESESDLFSGISEKKLLKNTLQSASEIVKDLKKEIEEQVTIEYSELRSNPRLLNSLVSDPYNNIQRLKDFETLWINISNYVQHLYKQQQIMELLSTGYIDLSLRKEAEILYPEHLNLADFLQDNSLIKQLIEIQSVKFGRKTIGLTEFTQYQGKWKDTI